MDYLGHAAKSRRAVQKRREGRGKCTLVRVAIFCLILFALTGHLGGQTANDECISALKKLKESPTPTREIGEGLVLTLSPPREVSSGPSLKNEDKIVAYRGVSFGTLYYTKCLVNCLGEGVRRGPVKDERGEKTFVRNAKTG